MRLRNEKKLYKILKTEWQTDEYTRNPIRCISKIISLVY